MHARNSLLKASSLIFIGSMVASLCNYLFQIVMGRWLSLEDYGIMNSLISIFTITAIPALAITLVMAKYTSSFKAEGKIESISGIFYGLLKRLLMYACLGLIILLFLSTSITAYLNIPSIVPVLILCFALFFTLLAPVNFGALQGLQHFRFLSFSIAIGGFLKLVMAGFFVYLGLKVNGAILAMAVAAVAVFWLTFRYLRIRCDIVPLSQAKFLKIDKREGILKYGITVLFAMVVFSVLTQIDMVLVKHYFTGEQAGIYASAAVLGKAVLYLPAAIVIAIFPIVAELHSLNHDTFRVFKNGVYYTGLLSGIGVLLFWFFPELLLKILFGQKFMAAAPLLTMFGLAMFPFAILALLVNFNLARRMNRFIYSLLAGAIVQVALICFYHQSLKQVLWIIGGTGAVLLLINLSMILQEKKNNSPYRKIVDEIAYVSEPINIY